MPPPADGFQIFPNLAKPIPVLAKTNKGKGLDGLGFSWRF